MEIPRYWRSNKQRLTTDETSGEVFSHTVIHHPPHEYTDQTPLIMALIKIGEKFTVGQLTDVDATDVHIGMPVESVTRILKQDKKGIVIYGKKYRPKI